MERKHLKKKNWTDIQSPKQHVRLTTKSALHTHVCHHLAAYVVFFSAIACFANSYDAEFVFDDSEAIINNKDLKPETSWIDLFHHDFWGSKLISNTSHKSYRPLTVLTFRWNYYLAGGLHPKGFHIVNILLHGAVSVIFLKVFSIMFEGRKESSFLSAVLFAVHPIHTESVAGVVGRADLLCALCFLLSFLCYTKACVTDNNETSGEKYSLPWMVVSMIMCGVSVLFKEQGITVLGICCMWDVISFCKIDLLKIVGLREVDTASETTRSTWLALFSRQFLVLVAGVLILGGRFWVMGSRAPTFQRVDNPQSFLDSALMRTVNYNYLYSINAWILLHPWWLCFDWSMGCVPVMTSLSDPRLLAVLLFWLDFTLIILSCLCAPPSGQQRSSLLGLGLMVITFLPASNLFFTVGFVIAERNLYLPSAGFLMMLVIGLERLNSLFSNKKILRVVAVYLIVILAARSIHRSFEWRTEKSLFESGEAVCPGNAKVHYNIAKIYGDNGNTSYAIDKYKLAISLNPQYDQAMNNLANILKEEGNIAEAESLLLRATNISENFAAAWMNLGIVQASLDKNDLAEESYRTALRHRKKYPDCYYNLGNLYMSMGRTGLALAAWRNATLQKPSHVNAWNNMIIMLDGLERYQDVDLVTSEALKFNPDDAHLHYNYANTLGKASRYEESERHFLDAIRLEPHQPSFHSNLAVLYHRWGMLQEAEVQYQKALQLQPNSKQTLQNFQMLQASLKKKEKQEVP